MLSAKNLTLLSDIFVLSYFLVKDLRFQQCLQWEQLLESSGPQDKDWEERPAAF